jgi:hypothetical protein
MSAQVNDPASPKKAALIRRFLRAIGTQDRIDSGGFLDAFALGASPAIAGTGASITAAMEALRIAYKPHQATWQHEYEAHVNWEFAETELEQIVDFLESAAGQHFLEGCRRMDAYVATNTEDLTEQIIGKAVKGLEK